MKATRFTLVELLVVIAIIAVLAALLLPSLRQARFTAKKAVCLSQLRQWGMSAQLFGNDHDGRVPRGINMWNAGSREIADWAYVTSGGGRQFLANKLNNIVQYSQGYYNGTMGQRNRVSPIGSMILLGYLPHDPDFWYCPDVEFEDLLDHTEPLYHLNGDHAESKLEDLLDGDDTFNTCRYYNHICHAAGYSHYLWAGPTVSPQAGRSTIWGGISQEHPYHHGAARGLTFAVLADHSEDVRWNRPSFPGMDFPDMNFSPMMFSCTGGRFVRNPHTLNGATEGVNGVFYDGSARWIGVGEIRRLAIEGNALDGTVGDGYANPAELTGNTHATGHWSGNLYKLQYIAHENLTRVSD